MTLDNFKKSVSERAANGEPFFFIIDFSCKNPTVCTFNEALDFGLHFNLKGVKNYVQGKASVKQPKVEVFPIVRDLYSSSFNRVVSNIQNGNTYLLNLTFPTKIKTNLSLQEIFETSKAPYKVYWKDRFVSFSPEPFIRIENGFIYTYPMKGTIDAAIENAEEQLLGNKKELWEHCTIVDLLRNDLNMVSSKVTVTKFRYVEKIKTNRKDILQTSSEIRGELSDSWKSDLGDIIVKLLPAGSISGAPKIRTVEIIENVEIAPRGYYTGVFGLFDGHTLESAVCIRFIEKVGNETYYKSGGGITFMSNEEEEYNELIDKIYIPV